MRFLETIGKIVIAGVGTIFLSAGMLLLCPRIDDYSYIFIATVVYFAGLIRNDGVFEILEALNGVGVNDN